MKDRPRTIPYRLGHPALRHLFGVLHRLSIHGEDQVPNEGAFILASNHASFYDPPLMGCACPRELYYFARKTLWKGAFGKLISAYNAIPVDRDASRDVGAFRRAFKVLENGKGLLVFPEGTRTPDGTLQPAKRGLGLIIQKSGAPVVPARAFGTYEAWSRQRKLPRPGEKIDVVFGEPLSLEALDPGKAAANRHQEIVDRIMAAIGELERPQGVGL